MNIIDELYRERDIIDEKISKIKDQCSHPEEARESEVIKGYDVYYDDTYYITTNHCKLCGKKWECLS